MDLSLTTDFESSFMDWDEDDQEQDAEETDSGVTSGLQTPMDRDSEQKRSSSKQAMKDGFSRLPSFPTSIGGFSSSSIGNPSFDPDGSVTENLANPYAKQMLYPLTGDNQNGSTAAHMNASTGLQPMVQYALTGQSAGAPFPSVSFCNDKNQMDAVSCLSTTTGGTPSLTAGYRSAAAGPTSASIAVAAPGSIQPTSNQPTTRLHPLGIQSSSFCPPLSSATTAPASAPMPFNPYMFNPYTMMAGNPQLFAALQASQQQMAAQFAAAHASAVQASVSQATANASTPSALQAPEAAKKPKAKKAKKGSDKKDDESPPFLLFDAPCELRHNFMQSQRMLNLPVHEDGNSYHYGMAVNGFHPQLNVATDPIRPISRDNSILPPGVNVKLIDGRHKIRNSAGKVRNEREQRRAQKITDLMEQIRTSIEDGGWKVEMKSKYHTLSMCADYVKHLIKTTEEKEDAVEKAKSDLEVKERKLEEDKALLEGRSDPESVTSSLTASTAGSGKGGDAPKNAMQVSDTSNGAKRKAEELDGDSANEFESKKVKAEESGVDSSGVDDGGSGNGSGPQGHNISIGKMSSSVSELTDSNRGSSDSGGEKAGARNGAAHKKHPRSDDESGDLPSSSSISSTAAVLRGAGSHHRDHGHADVVIKAKKHFRHRKRFRDERSWLDRKFVIDYEEVFMTSNVPQILATPAGRIVAWNKFFLKATGLDENAIQRLTIFSLVQPDKLANLFEMVAEALRKKPLVSESSSASSSSNQTSSESIPSSTEAKGTDDVAQPMEYTTMTLPCISFVEASTASNESVTSANAIPLYMTVTLMPDEDVRKRCFHCVFTHWKGTDGKMGFITPELLAKLFADPEAASKKIARRPSLPNRATASDKSNKESEGLGIEMQSAVAVGEGDSN